MCSLCRLPVAKKHNFGQILTFWGLLYRPPFSDEGQIWCAIAYSRPTVYVYLRNFVSTVYSIVMWRRKTPIFAFFGLRHLVMSPCWHQSQKVEHGCIQLQTEGIKIVSALQRLHGEIGRTNSDVQKSDGQTNKKNSTLLATPAAGEIRAPTKLGMVTEDLEHVLSPLKRMGSGT